MAAAVVSGAVALLLQEKPGLRPAGVKAALQATSTFMPSAGLIGGGAGDLNVAAAVLALKSDTYLLVTQIAAEPVLASGITYGRRTDRRRVRG